MEKTVQCQSISLSSNTIESLDSLPSKYNFPLKKARTQFSPKQVVHLEEMFSENQFPNARQRDEIAEKLDLSVQNVQVIIQTFLNYCTALCRYGFKTGELSTGEKPKEKKKQKTSYQQ